MRRKYAMLSAMISRIGDMPNKHGSTTAFAVRRLRAF